MGRMSRLAYNPTTGSTWQIVPAGNDDPPPPKSLFFFTTCDHLYYIPHFCRVCEERECRYLSFFSSFAPSSIRRVKPEKRRHLNYLFSPSVILCPSLSRGGGGGCSVAFYTLGFETVRD